MPDTKKWVELEDLEPLPGETWEQLKKRHRETYGCKLGLPSVKFNRTLQAATEYREDLARFPGDPLAYIDGPKSLQRALDANKAEGATIKSIDDVRIKNPDPLKAEGNLMAEAYLEAKAKGFRMDDEE